MPIKFLVGDSVTWSESAKGYGGIAFITRKHLGDGPFKVIASNEYDMLGGLRSLIGIDPAPHIDNHLYVRCFHDEWFTKV